MSSTSSQLERLTTGSVAFDLILGGGLPVRSLSVIAGEPGAGKTLFALREKQARLFQRFERAVSARNFGGLGLGLWIVRQVVEAHGGSISLDSELGSGSTFTLELPTRSG